MDNKWKPGHTIALVGILCLAAIVTVSILRDRIVNQQLRVVTVMGRGKVSYQPDTATVALGVQVDKKAKPEEALSELNTKMQNIKLALAKLGLAETAIETKNYSLYTQYDYKDNVQAVSGFSANQQLAVKVSDLIKNKDLVNRIIVESSKAGANQIGGVAFETSRLEDYKQQARLKAIEDAKGKATALATAAGVSLGDITNWYENIVQGDNQPMMDGKGGGGTPIPAATVSDVSNEVIMEIGLSYNLEK